MGPFIGIGGVGFYGFGINTRGEFVIVTDDYIFVPVHLSRSRSRSRSSSFMLRIFGLYFLWFMNLSLCDIVENIFSYSFSFFDSEIYWHKSRRLIFNMFDSIFY